MTSLAVALKIVEMFERIEIARVVIVPPVKLQQVETLDVQSSERASDPVLDHAPRDTARPRHPLGEGLELEKPIRTMARSELAPELSDEILGVAVVVPSENLIG